jgi:hypothetical protein
MNRRIVALVEVLRFALGSFLQVAAGSVAGVVAM